MVKKLTETEAHLSNGDVLPYGMAVWSTGVGPTSFTTSLPFAKTARGRIAIDGVLQVLQHVDPDNAKDAKEVNHPSQVILPILTAVISLTSGNGWLPDVLGPAMQSR